MQTAILGRQPKISLAELEALYGAESITPVGDYAALIHIDAPLPQDRLGGSMKTGKLLARLENTDLAGAFHYLQKTIPNHLEHVPEGKLQFGLSAYDFEASAKTILKNMLSLKKIIKNCGRSVRIIENKKPALEAAQVLYNKLTGPLGWELLLIKDGADCLLAQTTGVQNIDDYSKRDFERPKRDAYVGMLPPKLAQIMINLAVGKQSSALTLLDPFCGTGVVLQEALLMGYDVIGSDLSQKMVDYTIANLEWLNSHHSRPDREFSQNIDPLLKPEDDKLGKVVNIQLADATTHIWNLKRDLSVSPQDDDTGHSEHSEESLIITCETYLGKPLSSLPEPDKLQRIIDESNSIAEGFLKNIAGQIKSGTRLCLALPAWHLGSGQFKHLKVLDHLEDMGYNRLDLTHATKQDLIYHRDDQIVARELTILERI